MTELTREILAQLAEPFAPGEIEWKPQVTKGERALAVAYIDARAVAERLDQVVGGAWSFEWEPLPNSLEVVARLTVCGVTRCDTGEPGTGSMGQTRKAAVSDGLKRAAVLFGLGRYLYRIPAQWVDYDEGRKMLTGKPSLPRWAIPGETAKMSPDSPYREAPEDGDTETRPAHWSDDPGKRQYLIDKAVAASGGLSEDDALRLMGPGGGWAEYASGRDWYDEWQRRYAGPATKPVEEETRGQPEQSPQPEYRVLAESAAHAASTGSLGKSAAPITDPQKATIMFICDWYAGEASKETREQNRHLLLAGLFNKASSTTVTRGEAIWFIDRYGQKDENGYWIGKESRREEFAAVIRQQQEQEGQSNLPF